MKTDPIRWVCAICFKVARHCLTAYQYWIEQGREKHKGAANAAFIRVYIPQCCDREMLLAGEPKLDVHGLREQGIMIDPVDNLRVPT